MNKTTKTESGWRIPRVILLWLIFFAVIAVIMTIIGLTTNTPKNPPYPLMVVILGIVGASILLGICFLPRGVWLFVRWSCSSWQNLRRVLVTLAILATLIAIFYTEEDWRGKRAWENCKRDFEAKGYELNWDKYIPPPVPDDQNFFMASTNILLRFKKAQTDAESDLASKSPWLRITYSTNSFPVFDTATTGPLVVAKMTVAPSTNAAPAPGGSHALIVKLNAASAREQVQDLVRATVGRGILGAKGFQFSERQLSNLAPVQIVLQSDTMPSVAVLSGLIPEDLVTNVGHLRVEATGDQKSFRVLLTGAHVTWAADYLKWSDQFVPALDEVREALKRPCAVIPGDYSRPFLIPIPNFLMLRAVAQTLAQRAQCDFLLGQPDNALRELTLIHALCRILEKPPTGKPETLVDAMINVAITGLYVNTIAEGIRLHAWQEPQLAALQEQLREINLSPLVDKGFNEERASVVCFMMANDYESRRLVAKSYGISSRPKFEDPEYLFLTFAPRGWIYQNIVNFVMLGQKPQEGFDLVHDTFAPRKFEEADREVDEFVRHDKSPYRILMATAIPNYSKAEQVTAHNQTLANEAQIACALERYRLAHGEYPETLDALVPQFIGKLPHDIIGGQPSQGSGSASQPLHYRRTDDGKFLLYSVGWNETDDGGQNGGDDFTKGDWVWRN